VPTIPEPLTVHAPAKINLFLHVGARRADGFHALESLVAFTGAGDVLTIEAADRFHLVLNGPFGAALAGEGDNLVARAADALARKAGHTPNVRVALTKNLPVASGLGGGSADAAAALRGLAGLWALNTDLAPIAESLGSDVPACLSSRTLWMEGRGEIIKPIEGVPLAAVVLVNPGIAVSTASIFSDLSGRTGLGKARPPRGLTDIAALVAYLNGTGNDLEAPARRLAPQIDAVLAALGGAGALLARMSGSGATCFGLFEGDAAASQAARAIGAAHPGWWVQATRLATPEIGAPRTAR
jgi:4-diphosphocytidyl-2-C-methyl-D-erythritol kinase